MVFGRPEYHSADPRPEFLFPVRTLIGDQFRLEPFEADKHTAAYWNATGPSTDLYAYMGMGPFACENDFAVQIVDGGREMPTTQLYAVMTTRNPKNRSNSIIEPDDGVDGNKYAMAGIVAYCEASKVHLKTEIGPVILFPHYQGMGLAPPIVELMIQNAFADISHGGWGLRRVQWLSHAGNIASIKLAEKLKFRKEAELKWDMLFPGGKSRGKIGNGRPLPLGSNPDDLGRDSVIYARSWDD